MRTRRATTVVKICLLRKVITGTRFKLEPGSRLGPDPAEGEHEYQHTEDAPRREHGYGVNQLEVNGRLPPVEKDPPQGEGCMSQNPNCT